MLFGSADLEPWRTVVVADLSSEFRELRLAYLRLAFGLAFRSANFAMRWGNLPPA
jgi:hypothetical protein